MQREEETGEIFTEHPSHDPKGMGIAGLLTSDIYGLRSQLDLATQALIDERTALLSKGSKRTQKDNRRMRTITQQLSSLGFMTTFKDPFYTKYAQAISSHPEYQKPILTEQEIKEQEIIANDIINELLPHKKTRRSKHATKTKTKKSKPKVKLRRAAKKQ